MTNTAPVGAFRGAGRPEAAAALDRIIDVAAQELGLAPEEIRRRNLIPADEFPYQTRTGVTYDNGDYRCPLEEALRIADVDDARKEQQRRIDAGESRLLGIGVSTYVEITGFGGSEMRLDRDPPRRLGDGDVRHLRPRSGPRHVVLDDRRRPPRHPARQDHLHPVRHLPGPQRWRHRRVPVAPARRQRRRQGGRRDAREGARRRRPDARGQRRRRRPRRRRLLGRRRARVRRLAGPSWRPTPTSTTAGSRSTPTSPSTARPSPSAPTWRSSRSTSRPARPRPLRHVLVDDCGRILNPLIVAGQQHGGAIQGISQALWEEMLYDEQGTPITSSFADYAIPTAADSITLEASNTETPTPVNPLGAKGIGESATIGATPGGAERRGRRPQAPRRQAHRPALHRRPVSGREIQHPRSDVWREPPAAFDQLSDRRRASPTSSRPERLPTLGTCQRPSPLPRGPQRRRSRSTAW